MKILMVSPCFAPDLQVGALRMTSLAGHLLARGHSVTVLRALRPENPPYTPPPGLTVEQADVQAYYPTVPGGAQGKRRANREGGAAAVFLAAMRRVLAREAFDVMLISMGPFYTQPLCRAAQREFGLPCVLDFRDPGALDTRRQTGWKKQLWDKIYRFRLKVREGRAVRAAARVVTVVPGWAKLYERAYHLPQGAVGVIENGFDEDKLAALSLARQDDTPCRERLTIACFGKLTYYSARYAERFFQGAAALAREGYDVRVLHLGAREGDVGAILARAGFPEARYENVPFCPYAEGMRRLCGAQALLAIDERADALPTKIYDYIYLNKPVLFVGPQDCYQARLLSGLPGGQVAQSAEETAQALRALCAQGQTRLLPEDKIASYGRAAQNARYERLLADIAARGKGG